MFHCDRGASSSSSLLRESRRPRGGPAAARRRPPCPRLGSSPSGPQAPRYVCTLLSTTLVLPGLKYICILVRIAAVEIAAAATAAAALSSSTLVGQACVRIILEIRVSGPPMGCICWPFRCAPYHAIVFHCVLPVHAFPHRAAFNYIHLFLLEAPKHIEITTGTPLKQTWEAERVSGTSAFKGRSCSACFSTYGGRRM